MLRNNRYLELRTRCDATPGYFRLLRNCSATTERLCNWFTNLGQGETDQRVGKVLNDRGRAQRSYEGCCSSGGLQVLTQRRCAELPAIACQ